MFNLPDMSKLAQAAKEVQDQQNKMDIKKLETLQRIEQKLDQILIEMRKK